MLNLGLLILKSIKLFFKAWGKIKTECLKGRIIHVQFVKAIQQESLKEKF